MKNFKCAVVLGASIFMSAAAYAGPVEVSAADAIGILDKAFGRADGAELFFAGTTGVISGCRIQVSGSIENDTYDLYFATGEVDPVTAIEADLTRGDETTYKYLADVTPKKVTITRSQRNPEESGLRPIEIILELSKGSVKKVLLRELWSVQASHVQRTCRSLRLVNR